MTGYLRPTSTIAPDVLLPGDPGLSLALAQELLDKPVMANHSHGLWGYSGRTAAGLELTIQATGIGGPSAVVVLGELAEHGALRAIRIGRCVALDGMLAAGEVVIVAAAVGEDGTSRALGVAGPAPDLRLAAALARAAGPDAHEVTVASSDLIGDSLESGRRSAWAQAGAVVADLETAALLALGARLSLPVACALVVAETAAGEHDEEATEHGLLGLGVHCAAALGAVGGLVDQPSAR